MQTFEKFKIHKLIGEPKEAFYQLGLMDKNFLEALLKHLEEITRSDQIIIDSVIEKSLDLYALYASANIADEISFLEDYLEGSGSSKKNFFKAMTYPEILTALTQFMPLNLIQFGCSSLFHFNSDKKMLHLRVLDFPLHKTYSSVDRALYSEIPKKQKVFSLGPKGMPLHSLSAINENGISLAIHQKFDKHFTPSGTPVMLIAHEIITKAKSLDEVKRISKKYEAIGSWGLQTANQNGEVLSVEYSRGKVSFKEKQLEPGEYLYINNQLFDIPFNDAIPASINMYNHCRDNFAEEVIKAAKKRKKPFTEKTLLEFIQGFHDKSFSPPKENDERISMFTPSSVQIACFNNTDRNISIIEGESPKNCCNGIIEIKDLFGEQIISRRKYKSKDENQHHQGIQYLMQAQYEFDHKKLDGTYHNLQMASEYLKGHQYHHVANFFFNALNMINLRNRKSLSDLYIKFETDKKYLPSYLKQQTLLFQIRIQHILGHPHESLLEELNHPLLKQTWKNEENFPGWALQSFLKKSTKMRIDMFDFIYLHSRCGN